MLSIERTIQSSTRIESLPDEVPEKLWRYALAFLGLSRPSARFFWLDTDRWFAVELTRLEAHVEVRIHETELPNEMTAREFDVLTLVALGLTNGGIAEKLGTSPRTVSTQLEKLLFKFDQNSRGGLAAVAVDSGVLRMPLPGGVPDTIGITITELEHAVQVGTPEKQYFVGERAPFRIGVLEPVGADAEQMIRGAQLAVNEVNAWGGVQGRRVELTRERVGIFDWQSVAHALKNLNELRCDAVITNYVGAEHPEFLDAASSLDIPVLHTGTYEADLRRVEADPHRYGKIVQTCASETYYGSGMLRTLTDLEERGLWQPKSRNIVALQQESLSMRLLTDELRAEAAALGWQFSDNFTTPVGRTDWQELLSQARHSNPDVLLVSNFVEAELASFQDALLREPIPALVYCTYTPSIPSFLHELGAKADGIIWATTTGTYDDDLGRRFRMRFQSEYGELPGWSQAGAAYDQVMMLAASWAYVDSMAYLRSFPYRGVNGVYYFAENRSSPLLYPDTSKDAALSQAHFIYQVRAGEQQLIGPEPFGDITRFHVPRWI